VSVLAEAVEGTRDAYQLAGATVNRATYDRPVEIRVFRKVKEQLRLNIHNCVPFSPLERHGVMRTIGGNCLLIYVAGGRGVAATTTVLCQRST